MTPAAVFFCGGLLLSGGFAPLAAALLHELGHLAVLRLGRMKAEEIEVGLSGADIRFTGSCSYRFECLAACAGCAVNLLTAGLCALFGRFPSLCAASLSLALLNAVPALPLDGGLFLHALLSDVFSPVAADAALRILSRLIAVFFGLAASFCLFYDIGGCLPVPLAMFCILCWSNGG